MKPFAQAKYKNERNTLKRAVKNSVADRIELEIGDSKSDEFIPQAKTMMWDNEVNFSIRRDNGARSFTKRGGKIIAPAKKEDVVIYELEQDDINENGGLEIEILLKEKPNTNVFEFTLQTKGLDFFYQPELTEKEKKEGAYRPDNVVGSYAVYHKTKKNNIVGGKEYKTGKAFHIYRPKAIDANGNWVWCELNIDEKKNILTVTVPEEWLWEATYPVVIDPTFGYTSIGSSDLSLASTSGGQQFFNVWKGSYRVSAAAGNITKLSSGLRVASESGAGSANITIFVDNKDTPSPNNHANLMKLEKTITISTTAQIFDIDVNDVPVSSGDVLLGVICNKNFSRLRYDSSSGQQNYYKLFQTTGFGASLQSSYNNAKNEDPFSKSVTSTNQIYSIYATYTAAPSSSPSVQARRGILLSM